MFNNIYSGKKVLVTGHTGFKGSWLVYWLTQLGAEVCGAALPMTTEFNHFDLLKLDMRSEIADIRDRKKITRIMTGFQPDIVFHLAAQPLVRLSYREPAETFETNVMGTVNVLEACRQTGSVKAIVAISSDKCYENREQTAGYKESDPMGGFDPYSASKGCTELVVSAYRRSFFNNGKFGSKHHTLLASGRAGNVIGGGDWAQDRLVPDIMKAAAEKKTVTIRNPQATRPWQHVLEPLSGYLLLGQKLLEKDISAADGWNFGPSCSGQICVEKVTAALAEEWQDIKIKIDPPADAPHEAGLLALDCSKAQNILNWHGVWTPEETFKRTASWYREFYTGGRTATGEDWNAYINSARKEQLSWTK